MFTTFQPNKFEYIGIPTLTWEWGDTSGCRYEVHYEVRTRLKSLKISECVYELNVVDCRHGIADDLNLERIDTGIPAHRWIGCKGTVPKVSILTG